MSESDDYPHLLEDFDGAPYPDEVQRAHRLAVGDLLAENERLRAVLDAAVALRESLPAHWHGARETAFDEALDAWRAEDFGSLVSE